MKTVITSILLILALTVTASADPIEIDNTFANARKWLNENKLAITGGPGGVRNDQAAFSQEALVFYGEAVGNPDHRSPAQREMMAKRAAVVTAQRSLAEYLEGFQLVGVTLVKDSMAQDDLIVSVVSAFVKGSQVVYQEYNRGTDTAIAVIRLPLHGPNGFASSIYGKMSDDPKLNKLLETDKKPFAAEPVKLEVSYDGLIIDATGTSFRPALINRIFAAKGDILYDPAKISQQVLTEQGCGEYTNSVDKAKAALETRGVKNPLVVKAAAVINTADIQVSDDDAVTIFSADRKLDFLQAAKVSFVLK